MDIVHRNGHDTPTTLHSPRIPVSALLDGAARAFPQRVGCTLYRETYTYAELARRAQRLATALRALGAGPGRRVGLLLPNTPEYVVALQAVWLTGATALQLSPLMVAEEIRRWLTLTDCRLVIALDLLAASVRPALEDDPVEHLVVTTLTEHLPVWKGLLYRLERVRRHGPLRLRDRGKVHVFDHLLRTPAEPLTPRLDPDADVAVLAPTGGTTAAPKAVMLTHANLVANALQLRAWSGGPDGREGLLAALPIFHAFGLSGCLLAGFARALTVHLLPRFDPRSALELIERHRIDLAPVVPLMLAAMNRELRRHPRDLSFVRGIICGASALAADVRADFEKTGVQHLVEGYGLSEASPVTHVNPLDERARPGTIGLPLPDTQARVVDPLAGTEELPIGEVGELVVRGPQVMQGYFDNAAETAAVLRDGWLYTGDLARRDRAGYFTLVDRKKDIIKTGGFLVVPAEVEEVLRQFPDVADAAVIGEPDAERGEVVRALVVPRPGVAFDLNGLEQFCALHLGKQKRPRRISMVAELPRNFLGKVQRRKLREAARAESNNGAE
jgi:long-chain acyl-CoA synthetase